MKFLYILPGFQESTKQKSYQILRNEAEKIGFNVMCVEIDWEKPLSKQVFLVQRNSIIVGFSMGAIAGRLISQNSECRLLVLASMTPSKYFTDKKLFKDIAEAIGENITKDIVKNLHDKNLAKKEVLMYGEKEKTEGGIIVKNTGHRLTREYISEIINAIG